MSQLRRDQELYFNAMSKYPSKDNIANLATVTARIKNMNQEMAKFTNYTSRSDKALDSLKNKFSNHLSWMTSGMLIGSAFTIPAEAISSMQEFEYDLAGVRQVVPEIERSEEKAYAMGNELVSIARTYGVSVHEAMDAAKSIGRMYGKDAVDENGNVIKGSGVANTNLITSQAAKMAVADAFSMEGAFKGLEAALSQWNLQTENTGQLLVNTNRILEAWTIAAHAGAASAQDIGQAIEIAGTAAHSAGISFEFFNALVATGVRQTARSGNEIGQAIKSMMVSMQSDKSLKALQEWGIEIYNIGEDGTKSMRSFEDIILDVSLMMNNTEKDTRRLLMTLSGGRPILASRSGNVA
jgi:TP901 family phage tail tape measure protein